MAELGKIQCPRSLHGISAFCCPQNLQLLAQITNAFWTHCKPGQYPATVKEKPTTSVGIGLANEFVDPHKNRKRAWPDCFGN